MYLSQLKNGFTLSHLSFLFQTPKAFVSRYINTWTNFLYFSLDSIPIWPTHEQINEEMPEIFKRTFPSIRCILDCTELCQRPSSLSTQSLVILLYKSHVRYKGLIDLSPSGSITFVSELYDDSISNNEIVWKSGILEKEFWSWSFWFYHRKWLERVKSWLDYTFFLGGRVQLTAAEVKENQTIGSVRLLVELTIQRVDKFKVIRNEMPLTLHGSANQLWTMCCLLCNFLPRLFRTQGRF